ncbi:MAG: hypothetical protein PVH54_01865 [Gammaproteobacteria bacterium]
MTRTRHVEDRTLVEALTATNDIIRAYIGIYRRKPGQVRPAK